MLDDIPQYYRDPERTPELVFDLSLHYDANISPILISASQWSRGDDPFLFTVRPRLVLEKAERAIWAGEVLCDSSDAELAAGRVSYAMLYVAAALSEPSTKA